MSKPGKYTVYLNAFAGVSYTVEASSPKEAYDLVMEEHASISDVEGSDWDYENPGEITCPDGEAIEISELGD